MSPEFVAPRSALWRLMAYLHIIHAHQPNPTAFVNDVVSRCILPGSLERLRRNTTAFLQDSPQERDSIVPFLAKGSVFEIAVLSPVSLEDFDDCFDDVLPIHASSVLRRAFRLTPASAETSAETAAPKAITSLSAQFLIEGVDRWMNDENECSKEERMRMVRACGVSPAAIDEGLQLNPYALSDFVIDVIFPEGSLWLDASVGGQDWVTGVYASSVRTQGDLSMAQFFWDNRAKRSRLGSDDAEQKNSTDALNGGEEKRKTTDSKKKESVSKQAVPTTASAHDNNDDVIVTLAATATTAQVAEEEQEELIVSEDNIQELLSTAPHLLPREVLVARRKSIMDPTITAFDLESHFTTAELKSEVAKVRDEIKSRQKSTPPPTTTKGSNAKPALTIDDKDLWKGKKSDMALKLVKTILPLIRTQYQALPPLIVDVDADSSSDGACGTPSPAAADTTIENNGECDNTVQAYLESPSIKSASPKVLTKLLVDTFSRAQLNDYLSTPESAGGPPRLSHDEILKLKTKLDCAKRIVADCN
ncbi:Hypothetical protein, putative [Bodo saltans]|uniref:Uncharacterized protein n=1 Tax=Bodo saltans TaxID=75058 RepID=A0A0S4JH57_BODSA|nr:Hypothetical protein, putative [Bodo saltans]|eukprot:CUG90803.1 Hypothetical protein, putative [Bodo saltans]